MLLASLKLVVSTLYKKGRSLGLLPFFMFMFCCSGDLSRYGRVAIVNNSDAESFIFSVSDEFIDTNRDASPDEDNPRITKSESKLLKDLLKEKKYCLNYGNSTPSFTITSRQEKIYDMTFSHLIEQNYNARPVVPRMYFGRCKK